MERINAAIERILPLSDASQIAASARQQQLTKPPGSLGRLEEIATWLAGVRAVARPRVQRPSLLLAAADHGIAGRGVSAYPAEVTGQMVRNFAAGGAAATVLARGYGASVTIVDAGVATTLDDVDGIIRRPAGPGTRDLSVTAAMDRRQAEACLETGIDLVTEIAANGHDLIALGEMGIGNSTSAAALTAAFTGLRPGSVTGRGTGVSDERFLHKVALIERAVAFHRPDPIDPVGVLAALGGFEIAVLAGAIIGGAARRLPILLDGFITSAAALVAVALAPESGAYLLAAHRSTEIGHAAALDHLGLAPLLDLDLRLGEGSGALLALPIVAAAAALLDEMATFAEAGVSGADDELVGSD